MLISVVIPVYGCRKALPELYDRLSSSLRNISDEYEIIFVDDCCPEGSWEDIVEICKNDKKVLGLRLSRNFGQHRALRAGLDRARGDWVVIMDCDLQDRPEDIIALYDETQKGLDVVYMKRRNRTERADILFFSRLFYKFYNYFTDGAFDGELGTFCIFSKKVLRELQKFSEHSGDVIFLLKWMGYKEATIELDSDKRHSGKSSYTFSKKIRMATELIMTYSNKPLFFAIKLGFFVSGIAMLFILYIILWYLIVGDFDYGWPSLIASIYLIGGLLLSAIGVSGAYIANIFNEVKNRPIYIIQEDTSQDTNVER